MAAASDFAKRYLGAGFHKAKHTVFGKIFSSAGLKIFHVRPDSCVKSPCLAEKSGPIRHSAGFKTDSIAFRQSGDSPGRSAATEGL
jgi:hypothetical protein